MGIYLVNSAFTLITGTVDNDLFMVSGTADEISLYGLAGDDTISASGVAGFNLASLTGGDGNDQIRFTGGVASASKASVNLGNGDDLFTAELSAAPELTLLGGNGNDTFVLSGGLEIRSGRIIGGQGNDVMDVSFATGTAFWLAGGGANDVIRFSATGVGATVDQATIAGGGGIDILSGNFVDADASGVYIAGDDPRTLDAWDGADLLDLSGAGDLVASTINAQGGNDTIRLDAIGTGSLINGNTGNDSITITVSTGLQSAERTSVLGGAGTDAITLSSYSGVGSGLMVQGGGDSDTITLSSIAANSNNNTVFGGDGADQFDLGGTAITNVTGSGLALFGYGSLSESTVDSTDLYSGVGGAALKGLNFFLSGVSGSIGSGATANGTSFDGCFVSGGSAYFTSTVSRQLSTRVSVLNSLVPTTGAAVLFSDNTNGQNNYLFVQGGTTDLVVKFNAASGTNLQILGANASGSTLFVGFS